MERKGVNPSLQTLAAASKVSPAMIPVIKTSNPLTDRSVLGVRDRLRGGGLTHAGEVAQINVSQTVREIISDVEVRGDEAVAELTSRYDNAQITPQTLRVPPESIAAAQGSVDSEFLELVSRVIANIREYQEHIRVIAPPPLKKGGRTLGVRYTPVDRVGVYVPGGQAIYPSSLLMTIVPAQVAGVGEIVVCSPPRTDGDIHPTVLALAGQLDVEEVYRVGGAVAVGAMAVGTETIRPVDKIVGPGGAFVTEAKRQVLGLVGIDSTAGPSEVLIIADDTADSRWVAADLLAQAEHDPGSGILVTDSPKLAGEVRHQIEEQLKHLERREAIEKGLREYSAIIIVPDMDTACDVANTFASEHVQVMTKDDRRVTERIRHAGAIFIGPHTPVPLGDYFAGPSHVLPTGGTARFFSALSVNDFLKATSTIRYESDALEEDADDVIGFATSEGLTAHAEAIRARRR